MTDKTILDEVRGTIINIVGKSIIIQPDDATKGIISVELKGNGNSQFSVGQRVVHVSYTWKRPANENDKVKYYGMECPDEVDEVEYVTYDELLYDEQQNNKLK